jgi:catechol 2,3-dioxygenase-like lactoylglutathione lyase family enzyme
MANNPELKYFGPIVFVKDIEVSKKFYTQVLRRKISMDIGINVALEGGISLWQVAPDHIILERLGSEAALDRRFSRFELYFETEDIESLWADVQASGAALLHPLQEEPYAQRTVRFFDPDRHLIEVGEDMTVVMRRLVKGGMTFEQIAQKTGFPLAEVQKMLE